MAIALALFGLIALPSLALAAVGPNVSGTKTPAFPPNNDASARPGDTINYTISIVNTAGAGVTDATGVQVADTVDPNSTFVNNSAKVSPNAIAHSYFAAGNTQLPVNAANGLKNGVVDIDGVTPAASLVVTAGTFATSQGGSVTIAADGSFTYTPQTGDQNLTDTFSYTVTDGDGLPSTGLVSINLGARVWYVDSVLGGGGSEDGSSLHPYNTLADISGASGSDAAGDIIFVRNAGSTYDGNLTLLNNQLLYGSGTALTVNTIVINAAGGPNTNMTTTVAATNSITLASGNTVTGFTIGATTGAKIIGTSFGTLTISNVTMSGTGQALSLNTGTVNGTIDSLTTTSSAADGVSLTAIGGTFTITTGAISGATGDEFFVSAGTGVISYGGTISSNGGHAVGVQNKTGGSVTFSGAITATAGSTGINLFSNNGATMTFKGGLSLTTTTNAAFTATSGGIVNVCSTADCAAGTAVVNTLSTTTATALDVDNTTIGANGLTFQSINSPTASANAGILLNVTGSSGGLTVTGTSATAGTGGTISNKTYGVKLTSTSNVTLKNMNLTGNGQNQTVAGGSSSCGADIVTGNNLSCVANAYLSTVTGATFNNCSITGSGQQGINGNAVNGLTITNCTINSNGNESFEGGILLQNTTGTLSVTGTSVRENRARQLQIGNGSGTMTFNTSTSQYGHASGGTGTAESQQGILMQLFGTSNSTINATTLTFTNHEGVGFTTNAFQVNADNGGPIVNGSITGSTFDSNAAHVFVNAGGTATITFDTMNNTTMTHADLQGINYTVLGGSAAITANVTGTISGNNIGTAGANGCTLASTNCHAIDINSGEQWNGQMHLKIASNIIQKVAQGIIFTLSGGSGVTPSVQAKVTGNSVTNSTLPSAGEAIKLNTTVTSTNPTISVCWDVGGGGALNNTVTGDWATGSSQASLYLRERFSGNASIRLPGYGGSSIDDAAVTAYLNGRNSITAGPSAGQVAVLVTHSGTTPFVGGAACTTPLLLAPGGVEKADMAKQNGVVKRATLPTAASVSAPEKKSTASVTTAAVAPQASQPGSLKQAELDSVVATAMARWEATGLNDQQRAALRGLKFEVANLPSIYLGEADANRIRVSTNAAGNGWFIDASAKSDSFFAVAATPPSQEVTAPPSSRGSTASSNSGEAPLTPTAARAPQLRGYTDPAGAPAGHLDLLTTIMHEMGHAIGLPDSYDGEGSRQPDVWLPDQGRAPLAVQGPGDWRRPGQRHRKPLPQLAGHHRHVESRHDRDGEIRCDGERGRILREHHQHGKYFRQQLRHGQHQHHDGAGPFPAESIQRPDSAGQGDRWLRLCRLQFRRERMPDADLCPGSQQFPERA